jgi:hypothetical protein
LITIEIHYEAASRIVQRGTFPLKGRKPEQIALQFWKAIKKEMSYRAELERVLAGGNDITQQVRDLIAQELNNIEHNGELPF